MIIEVGQYSRFYTSLVRAKIFSIYWTLLEEEECANLMLAKGTWLHGMAYYIWTPVKGSNQLTVGSRELNSFRRINSNVKLNFFRGKYPKFCYCAM